MDDQIQVGNSGIIAAKDFLKDGWNAIHFGAPTRLNLPLRKEAIIKQYKEKCGPRLNTSCEFCHSSDRLRGAWRSSPGQTLAIAVQETDSRRANSSPKFCMVAFQSSTW
jgi:hypothetical protein